MMFRAISRAKMIFFNMNPSGRILNRFTRDISNVDTLLPIVLVDVIDVSMLFFYCNCPLAPSFEIFFSFLAEFLTVYSRHCD